MAQRHGLNTLTDRRLEYAFNALNGLDIPFHTPINSVDGLLTAALASVLIPKNIGKISLRDYKIFREDYSDLRAAIRTFIVEANTYCGFSSIHDSTILRKRVLEAASEVQKEYRRFAKSRLKRGIVEWSPFVLGGLIQLAADFDFIPKELAWTVTTTGFALKALEKARQNRNATRNRVFSLCTSLDYNVKALLPDV